MSSGWTKVEVNENILSDSSYGDMPPLDTSSGSDKPPPKKPDSGGGSSDSSDKDVNDFFNRMFVEVSGESEGTECEG